MKLSLPPQWHVFECDGHMVRAEWWRIGGTAEIHSRIFVLVLSLLSALFTLSPLPLSLLCPHSHVLTISQASIDFLTQRVSRHYPRHRIVYVGERPKAW